MAGRSGLVAALRNGAGITWQEANSCASVMIGWLAESLAAGEKIELRGFGTFSVKKVAGRKTPLNNGMTVPSHGKILFRPCRELREAVWNRGGLV
jgi:integration host factor subunit beta